MKKAFAFVAVVLFAGLALAQTDEEKSSQEGRSFKSTETFTYSLPDSFSSKEEVKTEEKDQERRKKLIEDIRKLYHAKFI